MTGLLDQRREVRSDWHVQQAGSLLAFDGGRQLDTVLVYAAVELRVAIERRLLEILILLRGGQLTEADLKRCRSRKGIEALMKEADHSYAKTLEFTRIVSRVDPGVPPTSAVDLTGLRRGWEQLSEYCHLQLKPEDSFDSPGRAFQKHGFELLEQVLGQLEYDWIGVLLPSSMPEETRSIYDQFITRVIDAAQAQRMLEIAHPILARRKLLRG